ncbi:RDD family protein [Agrococcus sp. ProA11]|uniref:RDD family protein n=1 Tax=Agrococcus chionoecetis TaxID=3153752 RepID=UPI0032608CB2
MIWEIQDDRKVIEGLDEDGRPDPAYAAALGLRPAPLGRRAVASLIEFAVYALLQLPYWLVALPSLLKVATGAIAPAGLVSHPNFVWMVVATAVSTVLSIAFVIVQLVLHGRRGVTLGKAFTGIRSVNVATLAQPRFGRALLRATVLYASFLVPLIGPLLVFLSPLFDSERRGRGWLDKVGATWFVDTKLGLDPYHEKRMRIARKTVNAEPEAARSELPSLATPADRTGHAYRPGARTSAGVVGVARPEAQGREPVGLAGRPPVEPSPHTTPGTATGAARAGGYRPGELSGRAAAPGQSREQRAPGVERTPAASIGGIVDSVPGRESAREQPPAAPSATTPQSAPPTAPQPAPQRAPQRAPQPARGAVPFSEDTILELDVDSGAGDDIDDSTVRRVDAVDHDDDLDATRARPRARATVATLAFDSGDRCSITGSALIGRNPAAAAGEIVERLLPVVDETRSISKTHLLITADPLAAVDRASTNGSTVVRAGVEHVLAPGQAFALAAGDVVRFGDRAVTIEPGSGGGAP